MKYLAMKYLGMKHLALLATAAVVLHATTALADDSELFLSDRDASTARANVLFIIDTSGSMDTLVATQAPFDSNESFNGCYRSDALYFSTTGGVPACDSPNHLPKSVNRCAASRTQLAAIGYYADDLLGWDDSRERWDALSPDRPDGELECKTDRGVDGNGSASKPFAANGPTGPWSGTNTSEPAWNTQYTVYDGNWLNWRSNPPTVEKSRLDIVKDAVNALTAGLRDVNIGVMRFNAENGGSVIAPMANISTSRNAVTQIVNNLEASGQTPLTYHGRKVLPFAETVAGRRISGDIRVTSGALCPSA